MNISFLRPFALAATLSLGILGTVGATQYTTFDQEASSVSFGYSQMNVKMDGGFTELKATELSFDPQNPETAKVAIEVSLAGIDAGYAEANAELAKDEWLAAAAHPLATFQSNKVEALADGSFQVTGDLSIKGNTKPVTVPFSFTEDGAAGVFDGSFTFQRGDFSVGEGQWKDFSIVANDIVVTFHIVAKP
ncbi:MAG: YceI family protein [Alcaligenaceae bacterium]|nr:YceI family protein [Alcaligenaceae bacterium]